MYSNKVNKFSNKNERRKAIVSLIKAQEIQNQQELLELLHVNHGIETTQSILSRDLQELGVSKRKIRKGYIYELNAIDAQKEILRLGVLGIEHNETLIVITVFPGLAAFVGDYIDQFQTEVGILGTIAGENTLFVAPLSIKKIVQTYQKICEILYFKQQVEDLGEKT